MPNLHWAAKKRDLQLVKRLIERGDDVNAQDQDGMTHLHHAAKNEHSNIVDLLIN